MSSMEIDDVEEEAAMEVEAEPNRRKRRLKDTTSRSKAKVAKTQTEAQEAVPPLQLQAQFGDEEGPPSPASVAPPRRRGSRSKQQQEEQREVPAARAPLPARSRKDQPAEVGPPPAQTQSKKKVGPARREAPRKGSKGKGEEQPPPAPQTRGRLFKVKLCITTIGLVLGVMIIGLIGFASRHPGTVLALVEEGVERGWVDESIIRLPFDPAILESMGGDLVFTDNNAGAITHGGHAFNAGGSVSDADAYTCELPTSGGELHIYIRAKNHAGVRLGVECQSADGPTSGGGMIKMGRCCAKRLCVPAESGDCPPEGHPIRLTWHVGRADMQLRLYSTPRSEVKRFYRMLHFNSSCARPRLVASIGRTSEVYDLLGSRSTQHERSVRGASIVMHAKLWVPDSLARIYTTLKGMVSGVPTPV